MSKRKGLEGMFDGRHFDREIVSPRASHLEETG